MKAMQTVHDLIEEAKIRTLYWALCIFAVTYFLTNTSKSMWMNFPIALLLVSALRVLLNNVEFRLKVHHPYHRQTYLSYLMKKQLSIHDSRLSVTIVPPRWRRKIDSPIVDAAVDEFVTKILQDFVIDLWYSDITPDKEAPELIHAIILDALGEVAGRVKELNLIDLLTRDVINLVGDHLDLYRRNQLVIGVDVMKILSTEEKDERLKHHLLNSRELHPALISPECEYKVLQRLAAGVLSVVLRPKEAQCSLVRCIARELITCMVLQPLMDFASPAYVNEVIERLLETKVNWCTEDSGISTETVERSHTSLETNLQETRKTLTNTNNLGVAQSIALSDSLPPIVHKKSLQGHPAHWARFLNAATQRRTEVLMPENLENMWSRGGSYKKTQKSIKADRRNHRISSGLSRRSIEKDHMEKTMSNELKSSNMLGEGLAHLSGDFSNEMSLEKNTLPGNINEGKIRRSNSTSALRVSANTNIEFDVDGGRNIITEFYSPEHGVDSNPSITSNIINSSASYRVANIKCRVIGAYFEKIGSKSFAVYSIAVTDAEHKTWFVKRRYSNFERLHRHLKDIPNYTLHLPPKRIFSSSTEDAFVHQRCIQLDKYLQDLLSIANVAEQHEVWDFLSASSKNYSFGKSSSVMRTLAVNVDDAMDDIVRQFKGASGGFVHKVVASSCIEPGPSISGRNLSWNTEDIKKNPSNYNTPLDSANSISDNEDYNGDEIGQKETESVSKENGWHSDNELHLKDLPPRVVKGNLDSRIHGCRSACFPNSDQLEGSVTVPPEWMPPNVSVPLLNLVDKVFQLKRRGWLRRQVFWISKQILQLVMEDAIDDFLLRQIHWIRNEDVIAQGIRWVQDALWPEGVFYLRSEKYDLQRGLAVGRLSSGKFSAVGSFETQLEASRRANYIKKMIFDGAPATLVSLIGHKQYKRCANDIYYFTQSNICLKQLAYGILELVLVSVFPELHDLISDIHEKMHTQPE